MDSREKNFYDFSVSIEAECVLRAANYAVYRFDKADFSRLQAATLDFVSIAFGCQHSLAEDELIDIIDDRFESLACVTPSGLILPKVYSSLEFNLLMKAFYRIFDNMNFRPSTWYTTLPLRVKSSRVPSYDKGIHYSQEPHLDSWSGFSNYSYLLWLPLLGDVNNNYVRLFDKIGIVSETDIAGFPKTESERVSVVEKYSISPVRVRKGEFIVMDSDMLHATVTNDGAKSRISIDNPFIPVAHEQLRHVEAEGRRHDRLSHASCMRLVSGLAYWDFIDDDLTRRTSRGGLASPAYAKRIELSLR